MDNYLTDEAEIPQHGERLNQTILDVGTGTSWNEKVEEKRKAIIVKTMVDEGERRKKKLSCPFFVDDVDTFNEFRRAIGLDVQPYRRLPLDDKAELTPYLMPIVEGTRDLRFSSMVAPIEFETEQGRYIRYRMSFFDSPTEDAEIQFQSEPTQFKR